MNDFQPYRIHAGKTIAGEKPVPGLKPDPGSHWKYRSNGMIAAYATVFQPRKPSTGHWIIQPAIVFLAW